VKLGNLKPTSNAKLKNTAVAWGDCQHSTLNVTETMIHLSSLVIVIISDTRMTLGACCHAGDVIDSANVSNAA